MKKWIMKYKTFLINIVLFALLFAFYRKAEIQNNFVLIMLAVITVMLMIVSYLDGYKDGKKVIRDRLIHNSEIINLYDPASQVHKDNKS